MSDDKIMECLKALADKVEDAIKSFDDYFLKKHETNKSSIEDTDMAIMELAELIANKESDKNG